MKKIIPYCVIIILFLFFSYHVNGQQEKNYIKFQLNDLMSSTYKKDNNQLTFLSEPTVACKIIHINKKQELDIVSESNQIFYIINGSGKVKTTNDTFLLNKDTILFVPRLTPLHFYGDDLAIDMINIISLENKSQEIGSCKSFSLSQIGQSRLLEENVWMPFVKNASLTFGLYMLPKKLDGDSALIHLWDEVNIITSGSGKFQVGKVVMEVKPWDIIFVRKGNSHFFRSLKDDLDILIFFEKKSIQ